MGNGDPFCIYVAYRCNIANEGLDLAGHFANEDYLAHTCATTFANGDWSNGMDDDAFRYTNSGEPGDPNNLCYSDPSSRWNTICTMPIFALRESDNKVIYASYNRADDGIADTTDVNWLNTHSDARRFAELYGGDLVGSSTAANDSFFSFLLGQVKNPSGGGVTDFSTVYENAGACSTCLAAGEVSLSVYESLGGSERTIEMSLDTKDQSNVSKTYENSDFNNLSISALRNHYIALANNNGTVSAGNSVKVKSIQHGSWLTHGTSDVPELDDTSWLDLTYTKLKNDNPAFSALQSDHQNKAVADNTNVLAGDKRTTSLEAVVSDLVSVQVGAGGSLEMLEASQGETTRMQPLVVAHLGADYASYLKYMDDTSKIAQRTEFIEIDASTQLDGNGDPDYKRVSDKTTATTIIKPPPYNFRVEVSTSSNGTLINQLTKTGAKLAAISHDFGKLDGSTLGWTGTDPFKVSLFMINDSIGTLQWSLDDTYKLFRGPNGGSPDETNNIYKSSLIEKEPFGTKKDDAKTGASVATVHQVNGETPELHINLPKFFKEGVQDISNSPGVYKFNAVFKVLNNVEEWSNNKQAPAKKLIDPYQFRYTVQFEIPSAHYDSDKPSNQRTRRRRRR